MVDIKCMKEISVVCMKESSISPVLNFIEQWVWQIEWNSDKIKALDTLYMKESNIMCMKESIRKS